MLAIQRPPAGLARLLSIFGGEAPRALEDNARLTVDGLQFFGSSQRILLTSAPSAVAVGALQTTIISDQWIVLFALHGILAKTGTQTALRGRVGLARGGVSPTFLFESELGPYGATAAGTGELGGLLPYPLVCPPNTSMQVGPSVLGTDANVSVQCQAEFGIIG